MRHAVTFNLSEIDKSQQCHPSKNEKFEVNKQWFSSSFVAHAVIQWVKPTAVYSNIYFLLTRIIESYTSHKVIYDDDERRIEMEKQ